LAIAYKSSDYVRSNAECTSSFQPTESLRLSLAARSRSALQIDPKHAAFHYLEIDMSPAYISMIKNHVGPQIPTNNRKRLVQQPQLALGRILVLNSELE
jgi:hypothetical protein